MAERAAKDRESFGSELPPIDMEEIKAKRQKQADSEELPPIDLDELEELRGGTTAALAVFADEIALGNLPAIMGFAEGLTGGSYVKERDRTMAQIEKGQKNYPMAAMVGKGTAIVGSMAGGYALAKNAPKIASKFTPEMAKKLGEKVASYGIRLPKPIADFLAESKIIKGAAVGAGAGAIGGALEAPPFKEGEVDLAADLHGRASNAALGAIIGAPFGALGGAVSKTINTPLKMAEDDLARREAWLLSQIPSDEMAKVERQLGTSGAQRAERVGEAGRKLGIKPTEGMLSADFQKRNLEDSLANTPTGIGRLVGQQGRQVRQQLSTQTANLLKDRLESTAANYDAGNAVKQQIKEVLAQAYAPIKESYAQISSELKNVPMSEDGIKFAQNYWRRRLKNSPTFAGDSDMARIAQRYVSQLSNIRSVENLRLLGSQLKEEVAALKDQGQFVGELADLPAAIDRLAERELVKAAIANTGRTAEGRQLAASLLAQKRQTDSQYSQLVDLFENLRKNAGLKSKDTFGTLDAALDEIPPEDLIRGLFDVKNINAIKFFQQRFPDAFETMRRHKLNEIFQKSKKSVAGEDLEFVDPKAFLKQVDSIPERLRVVLFGEKNASKIDPLATLVRSIPGPLNPSGTSYGNDYIENFWNPAANVRDLGRWMMLKDKWPISPSNLPKTIDRTSPITAGAIGAGMAQSRSMQPAIKIEGFPADQLTQIPPEMMQQYLDQIANDSSISVTEKAKLKNLANKHGLMPMGQ